MRTLVVCVLLPTLALGCETEPHRPLRCAGPTGVMPLSIDETVARINDMPKPLSLDCFLASLPRPLSLVATDGQFSAQPAVGSRSPRIFIMAGAPPEGMVMSVAPDGDGEHLLEFGEWVSPTRTIKGEIPFPVTDTLSAELPYDILFGTDVTRCAFCHRNEEPHDAIPGSFVSQALRPDFGTEVFVDEMVFEHDTCDSATEPERCDRFHALLDYGPVEQGAFLEETGQFLP